MKNYRTKKKKHLILNTDRYFEKVIKIPRSSQFTKSIKNTYLKTSTRVLSKTDYTHRYISIFFYKILYVLI